MSVNNSEEFSDAVAAVQEGDYETVRSLVLARVFGVNDVDSGRCSLLHWAAINNRAQIALFLIDNGAQMIPGGVLYETAFQWALRKRYYAMLLLLREQLHPDLSHRSREGLDALHLACHLGDVNAVFLLLTWGADVDGLDGQGVTPLLRVLSAVAPTADLPTQTIEIVRLLVRFGANVLAVDGDGCSALHLLARRRGADLSLARHLIDAGAGVRSTLHTITNVAGETVYDYAVKNGNRRFARFLFDMMLSSSNVFSSCAAALACLITPITFLLVQYDGLFYGGIYSAVLWLAVSWIGMRHRAREVMCGAAFSLVALSTVSFSYATRISLLLLFAVTALAGWRTARRAAKGPDCEGRADLVDKIITSSPAEGTDEENQIGSAAQEAVEVRARRRVTKDSFTGRIVVLPSPTSAAAAEKSCAGEVRRARTLGPRLCGVCLVDKRCRGSAGNISLASHCSYCGLCVLDLDHHCDYLGVCIGRGNRRLFVAFCALTATFCLVYFVVLKVEHWQALCPDAGWLHRETHCLPGRFPALFLAQIIVVIAGFTFSGLAAYELAFVARETTLINVVRRHYVARPPPLERQHANLWTFLRTGHYQVTYPRPEDDMGRLQREHFKQQMKAVEERKREDEARPEPEESGSFRRAAAVSSSASSPATASSAIVRSLLARVEADMDKQDLERGRLLSADDSLLLEEEEEGRDELLDEGEDAEDSYDEYDAEFVSSAMNAYEARYWQSEVVEGQEETEDEEEALLRSR
eukprot:gene4687-5134_t